MGSWKIVQKQPYLKGRQLSLLFAVARVTSAFARAVSSNVEIAGEEEKDYDLE